MSEHGDRKRAANDLMVSTVEEYTLGDYGEFGDAVSSPAFGDSFGGFEIPGSAPSRREGGLTGRPSVESTKSAPGAFAQSTTKLAGKSEAFTSVVFISKRDVEIDRLCRGIIGDGNKFCFKKKSE